MTPKCKSGDAGDSDMPKRSSKVHHLSESCMHRTKHNIYVSGTMLSMASGIHCRSWSVLSLGTRGDYCIPLSIICGFFDLRLSYWENYALHICWPYCIVSVSVFCWALTPSSYNVHLVQWYGTFLDFSNLILHKQKTGYQILDSMSVPMSKTGMEMGRGQRYR